MKYSPLQFAVLVARGTCIFYPTYGCSTFIAAVYSLQYVTLVLSLHAQCVHVICLKFI